MALIWLVSAFVFGLATGSFANVVVSRVPEGRSIIRPGSRCPRCLHRLSPAENIPVVSYLLLRGRCRSCGLPISVRYPVIELLTGLLYAAAAWNFLVRTHLPYRLPLVLWSLGVLVAVSAIDLETLRIPRRLVYWGLAGVLPLAVVAAIGENRPGALVVALASALGSSAFFLIIHEMNPTWMGFGDVRFALFLGSVLGYFGFGYVLAGLGAAVFSGTLIGLMLIVVGKHSFGRAIPFGPYLALGSAISLFFGAEMIDRYKSIAFGG